MSANGKHNPAEASDSLANLTAAAAGAAAIIFAVNVVEFFASETVGVWAGYGKIVVGLLIAAVYLPALSIFKMRGGRVDGMRSADGFLNAMIRRAASMAFNLTIGFLVALSLLKNIVLSHFTAEAIVDLAIAFALAAFSISFFVLNRSSDETGHEV